MKKKLPGIYKGSNFNKSKNQKQTIFSSETKEEINVTDLEEKSVNKQIKDIFRSKVRVAPDIKFESAELISRLQMPAMSRKTVKFFDLRNNI